MPTQSIEEIRRLVFQPGILAYSNAYTETPLVYPQITTRLPAVTHPTRGHRAIASIGLGDLEDRPIGQRYQGDSTLEGYVRQLAIRNYGKEMAVPREDIDAAGGLDRFQAVVVNFAAEVGRGARRKKEAIVANIYQSGRLAAGDTAVFNQKFVGENDDNPGKIYDGKPFFAASGNAHPFKAHTAAGNQGINLTASLALSTANLQTAITAVSERAGWDERGNRIQLRHSRLMVPEGLEFTAAQILNSTQVAETANNGINVVKDRMSLVVNPWLSTSAVASGWYTLDPNAVMVYDQDVPTVRIYDDPGTNSIVFAVDVMFGAAPWDWRYAAAHNMATS